MKALLLAFFFLLLLILPQIGSGFRDWDISKRIINRSTERSREKLKGHDPTRWFVEAHDSAESGYPQGGELIGAVERAFFFLAIIIDVPLVIGVWLAFKVASKWAEWQHIVQLDKKEIQLHLRRELGNYLFTRFVVGTGVNLILAMLFSGLYYLLFHR